MKIPPFWWNKPARFSRTRTPLRTRSLWLQGIREPSPLLIEFIVANGICVGPRVLHAHSASFSLRSFREIPKKLKQESA